jgi:TRAP transporter 4TM/12TM fusion protein
MTTQATEQQKRSAIRYVIAAIAIAMSVYHVATAAMITPSFFIHYPVHVCFVLVILFTDDLAKSWSSARSGKRVLNLCWDVILILVTVASTGYLFTNYEYVDNRMVWFEELTTTEIVLGCGLVLALLEAVRRTVGWVLAWLMVGFIVYVFVGPYLPEPFWHRGQGLDRLLELFYLTPDGIFNVPVRVTADYIFLFVLLGALLMASGAGRFFTDLAHAVTGRAVGGPAKTAVVSSAFMGMLQGSSAGNVVTTGPFTIPAMRRVGYPAPFAAGVEAVASSGGQLTPPIMGGAAFLMSELAGIPYGEIIKIALIPAILYFLAVFVMVDLEARRLGLKRAAAEDLPSVFSVLRKQGYLILSLVVLVWFLVEGYTPTKAGFWALVTLTGLIIVFDAENRRRIVMVLYEAMTEAPRMIAAVTVACAVGGMIAGIIVMTGLGLRLSTIILDFSFGFTLIALILTMIVCVVLGMGMPTSAAYIILAALLAPGLAKMGIPIMAAHFFIIYCAAKSAITPPVAVASYAAAAVAGTDPWRTSLVAFKLGLSVFIIPYMFVYGPELLGIGAPLEVLWTFVTASFGIFALSVASSGWLKIDLRIHERAIALMASLPMIYAEWRSDLIGVGLFSLLLALIFLRVRRTAGTELLRGMPAPVGDDNE